MRFSRRNPRSITVKKPSKLILASTKDYSHRIHIHDGIYAEVTLLFVHGRWQELPWTYPDYRTEAYGKFFLEMRRRLCDQRRALDP